MFKELIDRLEKTRCLSRDEYRSLIEHRDEIADYAAERALCVKKRYYGNAVYIRGLIEISSYCKNDCLYCGIRRSNNSSPAPGKAMPSAFAPSFCRAERMNTIRMRSSAVLSEKSKAFIPTVR